MVLKLGCGGFELPDSDAYSFKVVTCYCLDSCYKLKVFDRALFTDYPKVRRILCHENLSGS